MVRTFLPMEIIIQITTIMFLTEIITTQIIQILTASTKHIFFLLITMEITDINNKDHQ